MTRKLQVPLENRVAEAELAYLAAMIVVAVDYGTVLAAVHFQRRCNISYWDGLVIAAAHTARCERLYTEDLNDGQRYGELVAINPFSSN